MRAFALISIAFPYVCLGAETQLEAVQQAVKAACSPNSAVAFFSPGAFEFEHSGTNGKFKGLVATQGGDLFVSVTRYDVIDQNWTISKKPTGRQKIVFGRYLTVYDDRRCEVTNYLDRDAPFPSLLRPCVPFGWLSIDSIPLDMVVSEDDTGTVRLEVIQSGDNLILTRTHRQKEFDTLEVVFDANLLPISYCVRNKNGKKKQTGSFNWSVEDDSVLMSDSTHKNENGDVISKTLCRRLDSVDHVAFKRSELLSQLPAGTLARSHREGQGIISEKWLGKGRSQAQLKRDYQLRKTMQELRFQKAADE